LLIIDAYHCRPGSQNNGDRLARAYACPDDAVAVVAFASFCCHVQDGAGVTANQIHLRDSAETALDSQPIAAYFRRSLCDERAHLLAEISKRRDDITKRADRSSTHARHRLGSHLRSVEAQARYVDQLIARLDQRFANQTDGHD
jgi:hypothetical protein